MAKNSKNTEENTENSQNNANSGEGYIVSGLQDIVEYGKQISYIYKTEGASLDLVDAAQKAALKAHWQYLDHKLGNKLTGMAKKMAIELATKDAIDPKTGKQMSVWELEDFLRKHNTSTQELEAFWYTLQIEAEHLFDSFMLFVERKRGIKSKFYYPRREVLWKHGVVQALQDLEDDKLDLLALSLAPGTGKGELASAKIVTPTGFKRFGDIKVGDKVISGTGNVSTVLGVYPKPKMAVYELTFDDGSKVRCSKDHIWHVQTRDDRRRTGKYRDLELTQMLGNFRVERGKRANYSIDYVPKFDFVGNDDLPLHPYALGALLGDGNITKSLDISTGDSMVAYRVWAHLPKGFEMKNQDRWCDYRYIANQNLDGKKSVIRVILEKLGLFGKKSVEKHIPDCYLYSTYENRLELLRGLLDTDGYATKSYVEYSTSSPQLAQNVRDLVHSLGGYCSIKENEAGYKKDGVYHKCHNSFKLIIEFSADMPSPFWLERKKEVYQPKRTIWKRYIENIEYVGEEETICIYIDDPSHLYITDDYIITHNTSIEKFFAAWVMGRHVIDYSLFYSHSDDITRMFYDGVVDITTNETEYQYHECWLAKPMVLYGVNAKKQTINFNSYKPFASIQTTSVGAKNAGKVRCNRYLYCDDLVANIEEALNKNRLDKLWDAYSVDARQRMLEGCKEIHIATRWSVHDVIGRLERIHENNERARFLNIPCYDEYGQSNFQYAYNGFSTKFFKEQQAIMDEISFNALYMGQPIEREGLLYNKDEMRYYTELPDREPDAVIGVCDTKSKGTDYMFAPCFYQYDNDYYLVNCVCDDTTNYSIQYGKITDLICDNNMKQIEFESNAGGDRVAFEVDKMVKARGRSCNVTTKPTETNKETRIITYSDWIKRNVVFRSQEMYTRKSDYGEMMYWLFAYTQTGKNPHDDVPDGLANFAKFVERKYNVRPTMIRNSPLM